MKKILSNSLLLTAFLYILPSSIFAGSVMLTWQPNDEPDLAGYNVYYGTTSRVYGPPIPIGNATSHSINGLKENQTYYFALTSVDTSDNESGYSLEVAKTISLTDRNAPTVTITSPTNAATYETDNSSIDVSGNASDDVGLTEVRWANASGGSGVATGTGDWSVSSIALAEGENMITVKAIDTAGNAGSSSFVVIRRALITDTDPPSVNITFPTKRAKYRTNKSTIDLSGTSSDNVGVSMLTWVNDKTGGGAATGTTSWNIRGIPLVNGENIITVTATDVSENQGRSVLTVVRRGRKK